MLRKKVRLGVDPSPETQSPKEISIEASSPRHSSQIFFNPHHQPDISLESIKPRDLLFAQLLVNNIDIPQVNLPQKFGVQAAAPRWNRHPDQGAPFALGNGTSCAVVQHETDEETSSIVPAGTVVALKRYKYKKDADFGADTDLAHIIWQDLRVLCHPHLREHENFSRLLFVAWEDFSVVPSLAMELAAFGSLRDALESEFTLSWLQKCHVCLDISIGLYTLHGCGLVHGDLKPENIMLQRHEKRQIVAKLLDFAGVTDEKRFGSGNHRRFMSKLWLAPEMLLGIPVSDWYTLDLYAYGMLITHIWCEIDFEMVECYLQTLIPSYFSATEKEDMLLYFKLCPESDAHSVLSQSMALAKKHSQDPKSRDIMIPLEFIQRRTLLANRRNRGNVNEILQQFRHFAEGNQREIPNFTDKDFVLREERGIWKKFSEVAFFAFSEEMDGRTDTHKKTLLDYMKKVAGPPQLTNEHVPVVNEANSLDSQFLSQLAQAYDDLELSPAEYPKRKIHYQIGLCYLMGQGTNIDERQGLLFLASAALGRVRRAMYMYTAIEASAQLQVDWSMPHRMLLCWGYIDNITICADMLKARYPQTYFALKWARLKDSEPLWQSICSESSAPPQAVERIDDSQSLSIFHLIELENVDGLGKALRERPSRATETYGGLTSLHALSLISDDTASIMARPLLDSGANLSREANEEQHSWSNSLTFGWGTPIVWSIVKSRPKLFAAFLGWCAEHAIDLPAGNASIFLVIVVCRQDEMLRTLLDCKSSFQEEAKDISTAKYQTAALCKVVENNGQQSVMRRWSLGANFRSNRGAVARLLTSMDFDLLSGNGVHENPIRKAILEGDSVCLEVFIDTLVKQCCNLDEMLGRNGVLKAGYSKPILMTALYASTYARSMEAFHLLLRRFPQFIDQTSAMGWSPLQKAISKGDRTVVLSLLDHHASVQQYDEMGNNALVTALSFNETEIASLLIQRYDKTAFVTSEPKAGRTAFSLILQTYMNGRRSINIESFEFLRSIGGLTFVLDQESEDTVWRTILMRGRPFLEEHVSADISLLKFFLRQDVFGHLMDDIDWTGRSALHYASASGYYEAVELFIQRGATVNVESKPLVSLKGDRRTAGGRTPTDYVLEVRNSGAPNHVMAGGAVEIRAWQHRISRILKYLVDSGGQSGSGAPEYYHMRLWKIREPHQWRNFTVHSLKPSKGDQTWRGKWPERIPRCPTLSPKSEIVPPPWSEKHGFDDSDGSEELNREGQQTIVYRTSDGRRRRITDDVLRVFGPLIDTPPKEDDEEIKKEMDGQLRYAQAFISEMLASLASKSPTGAAASVQ